MRTTVIALGMLVLAGCKQKVDPEYLAAHEQTAKAICECISEHLHVPKHTDASGVEYIETVEAEPVLDKTRKCLRAAGSIQRIPAPGGQAPGLYEEGLDDESRALLDALRAQATTCERQEAEIRGSLN